jgi:hypothetical protein
VLKKRLSVPTALFFRICRQDLCPLIEHETVPDTVKDHTRIGSSVSFGSSILSHSSFSPKDKDKQPISNWHRSFEGQDTTFFKIEQNFPPHQKQPTHKNR